MCFVRISKQTAIISLYSIKWLVFITETESVYCAVRAEYLNKTQVNLRFQISVKHWWNDVQPPMSDAHLRLHVALNIRTNGRSLGTSKKATLLRKSGSTRQKSASATSSKECSGRSRLRLKCDGTRAEIRFRLSAKRTSPFKSVGASVQSTTGSRGVRIGGSNVGCTVFRGSVRVLATTPFASFPFTSPPVSHRVPSHFNWTLPLIPPILLIRVERRRTVAVATSHLALHDFSPT
jgi:hypothetical protein